MSVTTFIAAYLAAGFAVLAWAAWRDRGDVPGSFWGSLLWPLTLLAVLFILCVRHIPRFFGWRGEVYFDRHRQLSSWDCCRPVDGWPGIAISCPWFEIQLWKCRK